MCRSSLSTRPINNNRESSMDKLQQCLKEVSEKLNDMMDYLLPQPADGYEAKVVEAMR